MSVSLCKNTGD